MKETLRTIFTPDSNGLCHCPLGPYDSSQEKWESMGEFVTHVFRDAYPDSWMVEAKTDAKISYRHLYDTSVKIATQLKQAGIQPKTVLHMVGSNCFDWLVILLASKLGDFILSATHPNSPWPEISRNISTTCSTVLVLTRQCYERFKEEISHPCLTRVLVTDASGLDDSTYTVSLETLEMEASEVHEYEREELQDVCQMVLSSGTSGNPKAIKLTCKMVTNNSIMLASEGCMNFVRGDITLVAQPLAHIGGTNFAFLSPAFQGANMVVTDYPGAVGLLDMIQKYKMTHAVAVPAVLNYLAKYEHLEKYELSSLKYILTGGNSPNIEVINQLLKRIGNSGIVVKQAYGASEMNGISFISNDIHKSSIESIGISMPGVVFKIADVEDESKVIVDPGIEGQLLVKMFHPYLLYFNDPKKTQESLTEDGFYRSGDMAKFDQNFNVYITGRIKDVIKFRGFSVSALELEDVLMESELVADCSVIGQNHNEHFEIPVAFVVLTSKARELGKTDEDLQHTLIDVVESKVAEFKRIWSVHFLDKIPRNGNGKVLKRVLKDQTKPIS